MIFEHLKAAGIITAICSSLCGFQAGAAVSDSPAIASGPVTALQRMSEGGLVLDDANAAPDSRTEDADPAWASADLVAISGDRLDQMRGGFDLPSGLTVSFGISRAAFVNGNLVAQTSFDIPNIANMTAQQAQMLANANTGALIQVGPHNAVQQGGLPGLTGALIQNTLNGQQIQSMTTINTSVNSLGAFTATNFLSTMNGALVGAVRPR